MDKYFYTSPSLDEDDDSRDIGFAICDPSGVVICEVYSLSEAEAVCEHLNREY